jgi:hypothetical protein
MNTKNENEKPAESHNPWTLAPVAEGDQPEPAPAADPADFRETTEGGYGWGV